MSEYSDLEEMVAGAMAASRVPPSTVYMDGSHNPRPMEYLRAKKVIAAVRYDERAKVLDEKAEEIRRELVCCDVYERHHETGLPEYAVHHAICYWGEAAARLVEEGDDDRD